MAVLQILEVRGVGTDNERLWMKANEDVDLGDYIVTDSTYRADGTLSNKLRHVFEFPRHFVEAGQFVCLHSRAGDYELDKTTDDGTPIHRIYWGLDERIWNQAGDVAYLLYAPRSERQPVTVPKAKKG
jgi:hypothetical protein